MSLIEVVIFIIVLGIGFAGILVLYNQVTKASVDPMVRKQALAIASSLLEEIELQAFTYCDPDDPNVYTASAADTTNCPVLLENVGGAEPGESRYGPTSRYDNVNDYNGFSMADANIKSIDGTPIGGLTGYTVNVAVAQISQDELLGFKTAPAAGESPVTDALRITVAVTAPAGINVSLQGYRLRYAPNSP
jgi:MSHA pilin protein MshD